MLLCQRLKKAIGSRKKKYLGNLVEIGERKLNSHHNQVSSPEPYQWALEGCSLKCLLNKR